MFTGCCYYCILRKIVGTLDYEFTTWWRQDIQLNNYTRPSDDVKCSVVCPSISQLLHKHSIGRVDRFKASQLTPSPRQAVSVSLLVIRQRALLIELEWMKPSSRRHIDRAINDSFLSFEVPRWQVVCESKEGRNLLIRLTATPKRLNCYTMCMPIETG